MLLLRRWSLKGDLIRKSAFARIKPGRAFFGSYSGATFRSSFLTTFSDPWQLPGFDGFGTRRNGAAIHRAKQLPDKP